MNDKFTKFETNVPPLQYKAISENGRCLIYRLVTKREAAMYQGIKHIRKIGDQIGVFVKEVQAEAADMYIENRLNQVEKRKNALLQTGVKL